MNTIDAIVNAPATVTPAQKASLLKVAFERSDDLMVIGLWEECHGATAEAVADLLKEEELEAIEARVNQARANLAQAAEAQARAAEVLDAQEQVTPREAAARAIETKGFDGSAEVAAALRGDMEPKLGAETLMAALRDRRVPGTFKVDGGPIRTAIQAAWAAHNKEQKELREKRKALPAKALEAFAEFQLELQRAAKRGPGYATDQQIRGASARFFRAEDGQPPLVKALEVLSQAKEANAVTDLLRNDPQLASTVAVATEGRRSGALISALQDRAREDAAKNFRRKCGGKFGSNPYGQGKKSPRQ